MVAQELLREKQRPELADISKTIYPALEEISETMKIIWLKFSKYIQQIEDWDS